MWKDPIIEEIRQIRFEIEAECDNDFDKIFADAARIQKTLTNQVVSKPASNTQSEDGMMSIKPSPEYKRKVVQAEPNTSEAGRLDGSVTIEEAYEAEHDPILSLDPIEMILHVMDARGLSWHDLEPFLGSHPRVSEVLNRRQPLSLEMIRKLHIGLNIPADILIKPYELHRPQQSGAEMFETA